MRINKRKLTRASVPQSGRRTRRLSVVQSRATARFVRRDTRALRRGGEEEERERERVEPELKWQELRIHNSLVRRILLLCRCCGYAEENCRNKGVSRRRRQLRLVVTLALREKATGAKLLLLA